MNRKTRCNTKVWNSNQTCVICGAIKTRILYSSGKSETVSRFLQRKTCGRDTDCYREYLTGKGNPNYKGYMPQCKVCGKRISYKNADNMKRGDVIRYCWEHSLESFKNGELHEEITQRNKKRGIQMRGIRPKNLEPYFFQKGMIPWNRLV